MNDKYFVVVLFYELLTSMFFFQIKTQKKRNYQIKNFVQPKISCITNHQYYIYSLP